MFSKRHYEWLAKFAGEHLTGQQIDALTNALKQGNPNFKPTMFLSACWVAEARQSGKIEKIQKELAQ
jgi:hypothetical protein